METSFLLKRKPSKLDYDIQNLAKTLVGFGASWTWHQEKDQSFLYGILSVNLNYKNLKELIEYLEHNFELIDDDRVPNAPCSDLADPHWRELWVADWRVLDNLSDQSSSSSESRSFQSDPTQITKAWYASNE